MNKFKFFFIFLTFLFVAAFSTPGILAQPVKISAGIRWVAALPSTCNPSAKADVLVYKYSATAGLYKCSSTNTWTEIGTGSGGGGSSNYLGSFAKSALPGSPNAGSMAQLSDTTKGSYRFNGSTWVPADAGNRINMLDYCNPAVTSNCTSALQAAIDYLKTRSGGTIVFPFDYTFTINNTIDLTYAYNITLEGSANGHESGAANILFTGGAGIAKAFNLAASDHVTLDRMKIVYTSLAFNGDLIAMGQGTGGAMSMGLVIRDSYLGGQHQTNAKNAKSVLNLSSSLISVIDRTSFVYAKASIIGQQNVSLGDEDSYIVQISNCTFNFCDVNILNYGQNYNIVSCTFEPKSLDGGADNILRALDKNTTFQSRALTFKNNWLGDNNIGGAPAMVRLFQTSGVTIEDNWFNIPSDADAVELIATQGVVIKTNRFDATQVVHPGQATDSAGVYINNAAAGPGITPNYTVTIQNNTYLTHQSVRSSGVPTPGFVRLNDDVATFLQPNQIGSGLSIEGSNGTDRQTKSIKGITFGTITGNAADNAVLDYGTTGADGGAIRMANGFTTGTTPGGAVYEGAADGAMVFDVRNNGASEFFFRNGAQPLIRFHYDRLLSYRPLGFAADNTHDIGEAAARRPRTIYAGTSVAAPALRLGSGSTSTNWYYVASIPTSGTTALRDVFWNTSAGAGVSAPLGWRTTTAGTIGDTAVLEAFGLGGGGGGGTILSSTVAHDVPLMTNLSNYEFTISLTGALLTDAVTVSPTGGASGSQGLMWSAYVSAENVVKVRLYNLGGGDINPLNMNWKAVIAR